MIDTNHPLAKKMSKCPVLLETPCTTNGLCMLAVPSSVKGLCSFPTGTLGRVHHVVDESVSVCLRTPSGIKLFICSGGALIIRGFGSRPIRIHVIASSRIAELRGLRGKSVLTPLPTRPMRDEHPIAPGGSFHLSLLPRSCGTFRCG